MWMNLRMREKNIFFHSSHILIFPTLHSHTSCNSRLSSWWKCLLISFLTFSFTRFPSSQKLFFFVEIILMEVAKWGKTMVGEGRVESCRLEASHSKHPRTNQLTELQAAWVNLSTENFKALSITMIMQRVKIHKFTIWITM